MYKEGEGIYRLLAVFHIHCTVHSWSTLKQADQRYSNMLYITLALFIKILVRDQLQYIERLNY